MPLTPSDVEQMTFTTALRGYDLDEVDDFLDRVVVTIRDLQDEVSKGKTKAAELETTGGAPGADESAVGRALVAAQETADKILADARAESESMLEASRSEVESYETEQQKLRDRHAAEMSEHTARIASVREQLALLATQVADKLDEMDAEVSRVFLSDDALVDGESTIDAEGRDDTDNIWNGNGSDYSGDTDSGDADSGDVDSGDVDSGDADSGDVDSGDVDSGDADTSGDESDDDGSAD